MREYSNIPPESVSQIPHLAKFLSDQDVTKKKLEALKNTKIPAKATPLKPLTNFPTGNLATPNQQLFKSQNPNQKTSNLKDTFFSTESMKKNSAKLLKIVAKNVEQIAKTTIQKYQKYQQDKQDDSDPCFLEQKFSKMRENSDEN